MQPPEDGRSVMGVLLLSGTYERAHYAFMMAAGAAVLGRDVVVFATNGGCHALAPRWEALEGAEADAGVQAKGVAGFEELRGAVVELGVRLMACDSGLRLSGVTELMEGVEIGGIPSFLSAVRAGQIVSL